MVGEKETLGAEKKSGSLLRHHGGQKHEVKHAAEFELEDLVVESGEQRGSWAEISTWS